MEVTFEWKEYRASFTEKAEKIIQTLTLEEKVTLMTGTEPGARVSSSMQKKGSIHYNEKPYRCGGMEKKGIPPMLFVDGTRGVVCGRGKSTCFPVTSMRGATFSPELEEEVGTAVAKEVIEAGGNLFGGVCVNLPYHPGWGRAQETYGEDTYLLGIMGAALIRGVQSEGVIACVKHFAFNSMENSRLKVSVSCDKRTEREVFLPHFRKCVEAGAGAVMSAYNSYQGIPCGHHAYLLEQVLKKEWGFDGFVMNDFLWGITDTAEAVNGGMDMEMPSERYFGKRLAEAVKCGAVSEDRIDGAVLRIVRTLLSHKKIADKKRNRTADHKKNQRLALRCAREGITLLKNKDHILPLELGGRKRRLLVLGRLADQEVTGDRGSSQVYAPYVITFLKGLSRYRSQVDITYYPGERTTHCRKLAEEADSVVIIAGNDYREEGECIADNGHAPSVIGIGGDRINGLGLKEQDLKVINAVGEMRKDAIIVLVGGSVITMEGWHEKAGAIMQMYYPGMEGGTAFAETLFGKINPGGKLPFSIPEKEEDLPDIKWDTEQCRYGYYHGYTLLARKRKKPLYPFGFGLSYTTFEVKGIDVWSDEESIYASAAVKNTGDREGAEVLQMYVGVKGSEKEYPVYTLKAFQKIRLEAGEAQKLILSCPIGELAYYDEKREDFVVEKGEYQVYVGTSSDRRDLVSATVNLV